MRTAQIRMSARDVDLSAYAYDTFVAEHEAQLKAANVPPQLWQRVWHKLTQQIFDAGSSFVFGELDDEQLGAFTAEGTQLAPASDVFLIDHAWTFSSMAVARKQLAASAPLLERVSAMMTLASPPADADADDHEAAVEAVMKRLYRFGWLLEFVGKEGEAADIVATTRLQNYFVLDELGSRFGEADDDSDQPQNFAMEPLFFEPQQCAYSLCWPVREVGEFERARHARKVLFSSSFFQNFVRVWNSPARSSSSSSPLSLCPDSHSRRRLARVLGGALQVRGRAGRL